MKAKITIEDCNYNKDDVFQMLIVDCIGALHLESMQALSKNNIDLVNFIGKKIEFMDELSRAIEIEVIKNNSDP